MVGNWEKMQRIDHRKRLSGHPYTPVESSYIFQYWKLLPAINIPHYDITNICSNWNETKKMKDWKYIHSGKLELEKQKAKTRNSFCWQQQLTKKKSLLHWMEIHALDSRTLVQVCDYGLGQVFRRLQEMGRAPNRICDWQDINREVVGLHNSP